jgi:hypothetical protein
VKKKKMADLSPPDFPRPFEEAGPLIAPPDEPAPALPPAPAPAPPPAPAPNPIAPLIAPPVRAAEEAANIPVRAVRDVAPPLINAPARVVEEAAKVPERVVGPVRAPPPLPPLPPRINPLQAPLGVADQMLSTAADFPEAPAYIGEQAEAPLLAGRVFEVVCGVCNPLRRMLESRIRKSTSIADKASLDTSIRVWWTRLAKELIDVSAKDSVDERAATYTAYVNSQFEDYDQGGIFTFSLKPGQQLVSKQLVKSWICNMKPFVCQVGASVMKNLSMQYRMTPRYVKMGGAGGTTVTRYIPMAQPMFIDSKKSATPCGYQEKVVRGPGFWLVTCERTSQFNTKKCIMYRVDDIKKQVTPIKCETDAIKMLQAVDVRREETILPTGQVYVQESIVPQTQTLAAYVPSSLDTSKQFTYHPTEAEREKIVRDDIGMQSYPFALNTNENKLGGAASSKASGSKGKNAKLPNLKRIGNDQVEITDLDLNLMNLPTDEQGNVLYPEPEQWKDLKELKANEFYAFENPSDRGRALAEGFSFHPRNRPAQYLNIRECKDYLAWLIGVNYKMRLFHRHVYDHRYDAAFDTIGMLESQILLGLSKLESQRKYFKRKNLWSTDVAEYEDYMHAGLYAYVTRPKTSVWVSPIDNRNTLVPLATAENANVIDDEMKAVQLLRELTQLIQVNIQQGLPLIPSEPEKSVRLPILVRHTGGPNVLALQDDNLLALLATLQYRYGYAVNFWSSRLSGLTTALFQPKVKRFASAELVKYIDTFGEPDTPNTMLIRLQQARTDAIQNKLKRNAKE